LQSDIYGLKKKKELQYVYLSDNDILIFSLNNIIEVYLVIEIMD